MASIERLLEKSEKAFVFYARLRPFQTSYHLIDRFTKEKRMSESVTPVEMDARPNAQTPTHLTGLIIISRIIAGLCFLYSFYSFSKLMNVPNAYFYNVERDTSGAWNPTPEAFALLWHNSQLYIKTAQSLEKIEVHSLGGTIGSLNSFDVNPNAWAYNCYQVDKVRFMRKGQPAKWLDFSVQIAPHLHPDDHLATLCIDLEGERILLNYERIHPSVGKLGYRGPVSLFRVFELNTRNLEIKEVENALEARYDKTSNELLVLTPDNTIERRSSNAQTQTYPQTIKGLSIGESPRVSSTTRIWDYSSQHELAVFETGEIINPSFTIYSFKNNRSEDHKTKLLPDNARFAKDGSLCYAMRKVGPKNPDYFIHLNLKTRAKQFIAKEAIGPFSEIAVIDEQTYQWMKETISK